MSCWVAVAVWAQALHWDPVWPGLALGPRCQRTNTFIGSKRFSWGGHRTIVQQTFTSSSLPSRWGHLLSADQGACPEPLSWPRERAQAREQASRRALPVRGSRTRPPVVRKSRRGPGTEGLAGRSGREATRAQLTGGRTLRLHTARDRGQVPGRAIRAGREKRADSNGGTGARSGPTALSCAHLAPHGQWGGLAQAGQRRRDVPRPRGGPDLQPALCG